MAIKRFKRDNFGNGIHSEFFIDSVEDLEVIEDIYDCELGDKAFTPAGAEYVRHSDDFDGDLWVLVSDQHGGDSGGVMQCVIKEEPGTGDLVADKPFADVFSAIGSGDYVQIYTVDGPAVGIYSTGDGTEINPGVIYFSGIYVETTVEQQQPNLLHALSYMWTEADGVQMLGDGVATLSPAE